MTLTKRGILGQVIEEMNIPPKEVAYRQQLRSKSLGKDP